MSEVEHCIECGDAPVDDSDTEAIGPDGTLLGHICADCEAELIYWDHEERCGQ